jgi:branched-chain amino acid aminotransferase
MLKGIQNGTVEDKFGWNFVVTELPKGFVEGVGAEQDANGVNIP